MNNSSKPLILGALLILTAVLTIIYSQSNRSSASELSLVIGTEPLHSMNMARLTEKGHSNLWHGLNHLAVFPGLIGAFSCIRIGTVPWDTDGPMHGHYAMDIFYNGVYWCLLVTFVSAKIWWSSKDWHEQKIETLVPAVNRQPGFRRKNS